MHGNAGALIIQCFPDFFFCALYMVTSPLHVQYMSGIWSFLIPCTNCGPAAGQKVYLMDMA